MHKVIFLLSLLFLFSCSNPKYIETGKQTNSPYGWTEYCNNHPEDPACDK